MLTARIWLLLLIVGSCSFLGSDGCWRKQILPPDPQEPGVLPPLVPTTTAGTVTMATYPTNRSITQQTESTPRTKSTHPTEPTPMSVTTTHATERVGPKQKTQPTNWAIIESTEAIIRTEPTTRILKTETTTSRTTEPKLTSTDTVTNETEPRVPELVTRAEWKARAAKAKTPFKAKRLYYIIHHTGSYENEPSCFGLDECTKRLKSYQNHHMDKLGWSDIGYNFLIDGNGIVYEGRGWDLQGAHTKGKNKAGVRYNTNSIAINVIGNYEKVAPAAASVQAVKDWMAVGVAKGKVIRSYIIHGHRDTWATVCPGQKFYDIIKTWPRHRVIS